MIYIAYSFFKGILSTEKSWREITRTKKHSHTKQILLNPSRELIAQLGKIHSTDQMIIYFTVCNYSNSELSTAFQ